MGCGSSTQAGQVSQENPTNQAHAQIVKDGTQKDNQRQDIKGSDSMASNAALKQTITAETPVNSLKLDQTSKEHEMNASSTPMPTASSTEKREERRHSNAIKAKSGFCALQDVEDTIEQPAEDWLPEYLPRNVIPPVLDQSTTFSSRGTRTSKANILQKQKTTRKTKIVCTMGPACWSEEAI
eukprot:767124-Hanusia_phi.AAC.4